MNDGTVDGGTTRLFVNAPVGREGAGVAIGRVLVALTDKVEDDGKVPGCAHVSEVDGRRAPEHSALLAVCASHVAEGVRCAECAVVHLARSHGGASRCDGCRRRLAVTPAAVEYRVVRLPVEVAGGGGLVRLNPAVVDVWLCLCGPCLGEGLADELDRRRESGGGR